jgi:hypothetical protein
MPAISVELLGAARQNHGSLLDTYQSNGRRMFVNT